MARYPGREATYAAAGAFRSHCLVAGKSLMWPELSTWTVTNVNRMVHAFLGRPDTGPRKFTEKLEDQISNEGPEVHRLAADLLAFYYLFPGRISVDKKLETIQEVTDWQVGGTPPALPALTTAFREGGVGYPGTFYNTGRPWHLAFYLKFAQVLLREGLDPNDPAICVRIADQVEAASEHKSHLGKNILLHLFFPDRFERVASGRQKALIVGKLRLPDDPTDQDEALLAIRGRLERERGGRSIDFYDDDIWPTWDPSRSPDAGDDESAEELDPPSVWIEKTHVQGRADRQSGEYSLGKMLWSPQRSQAGGDIYRFMRDVRPGDRVIHLTDNEGFTGISVAESAHEEFGGVADTEWANRPSYRVRLRSYQKLDPPLRRATFFASPYKERLVALIDGGHSNLFFSREPSLNQGAYLTPAPPDLVAVLNDAYRATAGKALFGSARIDPQPEKTRLPPPREDLYAITAEFSDALRRANLDFGPRHANLVRAFLASLATKRFVILTGLSGSEKTQIAIKFGQWLGRKQYKVVAVRPDWTGPDALFGYEDALRQSRAGKQGWHVPEVLEFMLAAAQDPMRPYALILDEMNLAHVERYFADALSGIETSEPCLPNLTRGSDGVWVQSQTSVSKLPFPSNLFVVGTVNVDETTYLFSPKVLDRANTFEFRVATDGLSAIAQRPIELVAGDPALVRGLLEIARNEQWHLTNVPVWLDEYSAQLRTLHQLLGESALEFGHRVYYEAVRFAALHAEAGEQSMEAALDRQVLQKILPRIHGSRKRVEAALSALGEFCSRLTYAVGEAHPGGRATFDVAAANVHEARLPLSLDKVQRMMRTLKANQFTSFTD